MTAGARGWLGQQSCLCTPSPPGPLLLPMMLLLGVGVGLFNPLRAFLFVGVTQPAKAGVASGITETFPPTLNQP